MGDLEKIINNDDLKSKCSTILETYQNKVKLYEDTGNFTIKDVQKESDDTWYEEILKNRKIKIKQKQKK